MYFFIILAFLHWLQSFACGSSHTVQGPMEDSAILAERMCNAVETCGLRLSSMSRSRMRQSQEEEKSNSSVLQTKGPTNSGNEDCSDPSNGVHTCTAETPPRMWAQPIHNLSYRQCSVGRSQRLRCENPFLELGF